MPAHQWWLPLDLDRLEVYQPRLSLARAELELVTLPPPGFRRAETMAIPGNLPPLEHLRSHRLKVPLSPPLLEALLTEGLIGHVTVS